MHLEWLSLRRTAVTDDGLATAKQFKNLVLLRIESPLITDQGLQHVGEIKGLRELWLDHVPRVTDTGLEHLKTLTEVRSLMVRGTQVTDAGLEDLKAALPQGGVHR